ncbi:MAG: cytochrome C oxidase subunit IV family protein [Planctomycetota bacterium]
MSELKAHPYAKDLSKLSPEDRALVGNPDGNIPATQTQAQHGVDDHELAHPLPLWMLWGTFAALMVLSVLTVLAVEVDLGALNIWIALGIAAVKAAFVAIIFMHLRWDNPFNTVALIAALAFLVLFVGIAILDTGQYQDLKTPPGGYAPSAEAPGAE